LAGEPAFPYIKCCGSYLGPNSQEVMMGRADESLNPSSACRAAVPATLSLSVSFFIHKIGVIISNWLLLLSN
jgi:hypothetical protein